MEGELTNSIKYYEKVYDELPHDHIKGEVG